MLIEQFSKKDDKFEVLSSNKEGVLNNCHKRGILKNVESQMGFKPMTFHKPLR